MNQQSIPFLDLVSQHRELEDELVQVCREAIHSAHFIGGPQLEAFESEFAAYCGAKYCVGVGSGTDAVRFTLIAAGVGAGDAVITVPHTFMATVEAISQAGAAIELVDIDERTYCMSPQALAEYLNGCTTDPQTGRPIGRRSGLPIKAIVPVHLYGQVADMDALTSVAERHNLLVIEDACQAHGAEYNSQAGWRRAGSFGKAAAFSFYPGKNLGACGEAGAITTDDEQIARFCRMVRDHGQSAKYYHDIEGYNGRLDAIQAGLLRVKLRHLADWNEQRRNAADEYRARLADAGELMTLPYVPAGSRPVFHLYVVKVQDREQLRKDLAAAGIGTGIHYPIPVHLLQAYERLGFKKGDFPITEAAAGQILSLPMFPGLTSEQIGRISDSVLRSLGATREGVTV